MKRISKFPCMIVIFYIVSIHTLIHSFHHFIRRNYDKYRVPILQSSNQPVFSLSNFPVQEDWITGNQIKPSLTSLYDPSYPTPIKVDSKVIDSDMIKFLRSGHIFMPDFIQSSYIKKDLTQAIQSIFEEEKLQSYRHAIQVTGKGTPEEIETMSIEECEKRIGSDDFPFMQVFHLWKKSSIIRTLALNPSLGKIAADLLGVSGVRLYQDSIFVKRPGNGPTQWHSDLNMCPFDTNDFITCWIPLQVIPSQAEGGTGLSFASGSHRDFALPYWNDLDVVDMEGRYEIEAYNGYKIGDCSFHHGWCLHSSPPNEGNDTRIAYSISFVADGAKILNEEGHIRYPDDEDADSYGEWMEDVGWGGIASHPMLPLVYTISS